MRQILIGLDLGTTLCKCAAYTVAGDQLAMASREVPTDRSIQNGAEQLPSDWTDAVADVLAEVASALDEAIVEVAAIGISAHGPGAVLADKNGNALCPTAIWQDNRCAQDGYALFDEIGYEWVGHGMPQTGFAARLRWLLRTRPELAGKIAHIHDIKGYLLHFLTGAYVTEPSSSADGLKWDKNMLDACGVREELMDEIVPSDAKAGGLCAAVAQRTGFFNGTPVICGLNDGASAMLGSGTLNTGSGVVSVSTNGIARLVLDKKLPGRYLYEHSLFCWPYVDGKYVAGGFTKSAGDTVQWFLNLAYSGCSAREGLELFNLEAETSGLGARALMFYPWLLGRGSPAATEQPEGSFIGLARHHTRGDCARAIFEGLAFALRDVGAAFRDMGYAWKEIALTGGGMKSPLWRSIICDGLDIDGRRAAADSLLGAAIMAGVGAGIYKNAEEACAACVRRGEPVSRNAAATAYYERAYARYRTGKQKLAEYQAAVGRETL